VQPVLDHQRRDRRDLDHLMAQRIWILAVQQGAAVAAGIGVVFHHFIHPADLLPQAGQFGSQGGEFAAELLDLLLLGQDELSGLGWPRQPIRFWNPGRRRAHHRRSLPEMQPGIKL